jgi:hypothetical protein
MHILLYTFTFAYSCFHTREYVWKRKKRRFLLHENVQVNKRLALRYLRWIYQNISLIYAEYQVSIFLYYWEFTILWRDGRKLKSFLSYCQRKRNSADGTIVPERAKGNVSRGHRENVAKRARRILRKNLRPSTAPRSRIFQENGFKNPRNPMGNGRRTMVPSTKGIGNGKGARVPSTELRIPWKLPRSPWALDNEVFHGQWLNKPRTQVFHGQWLKTTHPSFPWTMVE